MAKEIILPKLGQTMEEGTIVKWIKKEGDKLKKGDILLEIQTDKAVLEVESFAEGTLLKTLAQEGEVVPVLATIGYVGKPGEALPKTAPPSKTEQPQKKEPAEAAPVEKRAAKPIAPSPERAPAPTAAAPLPHSIATASPAAEPGRLRISPRAKKLVHEAAVNPQKIKGSGPENRIVEKDVLAHLDRVGYYDLKITPIAKMLARQYDIDITEIKGSGVDGRIMKTDVLKAENEKPKPLTQMRRIIAQRMSQSASTMPHFFATTAVDMTNIVELREKLKKTEPDFKISLNDFIIAAVAQALREFPIVNSVCYGETYSIREEINIGIAVSIDDGLIVPVIRNADKKKLRGIARESRELAEKARSKKLTPEEYSGGTFTITNMGMLGLENFIAIINPGEAAILAVGAVQPTPIVVDGKIAIRSIMKVNICADHRVVDGATGAGFLRSLKERLETSRWKV